MWLPWIRNSYCPGEMQLHTCRRILTHNLPIQTCSAIRKLCMLISNSDRHTTGAIQRWIHLLPKLNSFPFTVQDRNPICSVLLSFTTPVLSRLSTLPLFVLFKCYSFEKDHSHLNLHNTEVYDAYKASLESKAPQGAEPCRIRRVRNKLPLQKPWLNLSIRVVCCFNYHRRYW